MALNVSELVAALPDEGSKIAPSAHPGLPEVLSRWSWLPVPVGRFQRLTALGTLQAKIGAAYLFHWLRGWFRNAADNQRLLAEAHWRTAVRVLDSMSYLRGAVMQIRQTLAQFPHIAPREVLATLERLHYDARPMH